MPSNNPHSTTLGDDGTRTNPTPEDITYHWTLVIIGVQWTVMIYIATRCAKRTIMSSYNIAPLVLLCGSIAFLISLTMTLFQFTDLHLSCEEKWLAVFSVALACIAYGLTFVHFLTKAHLLNRKRRSFTVMQGVHVVLVLLFFASFGLRLHFMTGSVSFESGLCTGRAPSWVVLLFWGVVVANTVISTLHFVTYLGSHRSVKPSLRFLLRRAVKAGVLNVVVATVILAVTAAIRFNYTTGIVLFRTGVLVAFVSAMIARPLPQEGDSSLRKGPTHEVENKESREEEEYELGNSSVHARDEHTGTRKDRIRWFAGHGLSAV